jgi:hypothetical protein
MTGEDFAAQYQLLSDGALTQLASEGGLRSEADTALRAEMRKRSIGTKEVRSLRVTQKKAKLQRVNHNPYSYQGTGLRLRGHKFLNEADGKQRNRCSDQMDCFFFYAIDAARFLSCDGARA